MKSESFQTLYRHPQTATLKFKTQKVSKDIDKIVHVTSVVGSTMLWSYENTIVCKDNKNNHFIKQFPLFQVIICCRSWENHNLCYEDEQRSYGLGTT